MSDPLMPDKSEAVVATKRPPDAWLLVCDDGKRYASCKEPFRTTPAATAYPLYAGAALQAEEPK